MSKKTKMRECPAAGRIIETWECGLGRHTTYACPEHCVYNPFSPQHYESYRDLENAAETRFIDWMKGHLGNPHELQKIIEETEGDLPDSRFFHALAWYGVYRKDTNGETCLQRMAQAGFPGASKDEQTLLRSKLRMRPIMAEVRQIMDDHRTEVVDLLDRDRSPFILFDFALASVAVRFGVYAIHSYPLPHYHRLFGIAYLIPSLPPLDPHEIICETIRHIGGGTDEEQMRTWLMQNYARFEDAIGAVGLARRKMLFENLDAMFGKAVYELASPFDECKTRLCEAVETSVDELSVEEQQEGFSESRVWFAKADDPEHGIIGEGAALGRVLLGRSHWRIECIGGSRLDRFRERFESLMQHRIRFVAERRDNIAARLRAQEPAYDQSLVAPRLLRNPPELSTGVARVPARQVQPAGEMTSDFLHQQDLRWLDDSIPALNGQTPRQAAPDPALRPELIRLMKERIRDCDTRNLEEGLADDINWMVRELGLTEILFDPPPRRPPVKFGVAPEEEGSHEEDDHDGRWLDLPDPPPFPQHQLTHEEAVDRFTAAMSSWSSLNEALEYFESIEYPLLRYLQEISEGLLSRKDLQFLAPLLAVVIFAFTPRGTCPPLIGRVALTNAFHHDLPRLDPDAADFDDAMGDWIGTSRQPELLKLFLVTLLKLVDDAPDHLRPGPKAKTGFVIILHVLVNEFDRLMQTSE